jgi:integrase
MLGLLYKRSDSQYYWFQIRFKGRLYQRSTKVTNQQVARQIESKFRTDLATGAVGLTLAKDAPLLAHFIERDFLPFIKSTKSGKANTLHYYQHHAGVLKESSLSNLPLDAIDQKMIARYAANRRGTGLSVATVNRELQVLRRIFKLAMEWSKVRGVLPTVKMLPGEHRRERVVSPKEENKYLDACPPLLKDVATLLFDLALRPDECFRLTTENFQGDFCVIFYGKGRGSRRKIPMSDRVKRIVARLSKTASPWLFPAPTKAGHINQSSLKKQHLRAIEASGVPFFVPYSIRHTAITRWSNKVDAYTLHFLAGHVSMQTTERYVHIGEDRLKGILSVRKKRQPKRKTKSLPRRSFRRKHGETAKQKRLFSRF